MVNITIYGVGLIGGSLALCYKGKPGFRVTGHSPNPASVEKYLKRGVVDRATTDFAEAAAGADFIFLCVPVGNLEAYLSRLYELPLKEGCIITDVGSTKKGIVETADRLAGQRKGPVFIGGHPMAGKEKSGVEAATGHLFENAFYVLTPGRSAGPDDVRRLASLLEHPRAQIVELDADTHDRIVGAISHLPHIIAVALVNLVASFDRENGMYRLLAAGGFRDITRIASSDPVIWPDILLSNRDVLLPLLEDWNREIDGFIRLLEAGDGAGIAERFARAGAFRSQLPERRKGVLASMYDIYVDVTDEPGIIGKIATRLGERQINLSNVQIMESRLDVPGVLRLSFREEADMLRAEEALKEMGCSVHL